MKQKIFDWLKKNKKLYGIYILILLGVSVYVVLSPKSDNVSGIVASFTAFAILCVGMIYIEYDGYFISLTEVWVWLIPLVIPVVCVAVFGYLYPMMTVIGLIFLFIILFLIMF